MACFLVSRLMRCVVSFTVGKRKEKNTEEEEAAEKKKKKCQAVRTRIVWLLDLCCTVATVRV